MNRILFSLIFCTFSLSETILIPEDYLTIQEGIDASVDGDTVLVADGDYVENLVLDKSIVLASLAIYDNLDEWIIFDEETQLAGSIDMCYKNKNNQIILLDWKTRRLMRVQH